MLLLRYRSRLVLRACRSFSPFRILYEHDRELLVKTFAVASLLNFLDVAVIALARQRLLGAFMRVLVFEDHVVGYANDVMYFFYVLGRRMGRWSRAACLLGLLYLLGLLRGQSTVFFLYAPLGELARRWRGRGIPYEYAEYLLAGRAAARLLERMSLKITYIDTSKPIPKVFAKILCSLKEVVENGK
ncbi:MAG: hypothetical protein LM580_08495 [Thermofilum sp.]|nr:hypothetical protein [Thermofilum sp.]